VITVPPSGAGCVVRYDGKRGVVWRLKYRDADGRQVMETLGSATDGWTRKRAEAELRERLVKIERRGWRKPAPLTFTDYSKTWFEESMSRRNWKRGSVLAFRCALQRLEPTFGPMHLARIHQRDVAAYVASQSKRYAAKTINLDLSVLHDVLKCAMRDEFVDRNVVALVERPKTPRRRWRLLRPAEIPVVERSFTNEQARAMFTTLVLTGVRRLELLDLRWRDVDLVDMVLRVADSKTEEGIRSIAITPKLAETLWQQRRRSHYIDDENRVFCHPKRGSRLDHEWYAAEFRKALKEAGITDYIRPFHDMRRTALTNYAAATGNPVALMATAGHRSFATTKGYLQLAGITFADEAAALEDRLYGTGRKFYPSETTSDDPASPNAAQEAVVEAG
jgi:integrase